MCVCVCKSSMLMLPNICGGRHAWECVWTCIRVCVYMCASVIKAEESQCVRWSVCSRQSSSHTLPEAISLAEWGTSSFFFFFSKSRAAGFHVGAKRVYTDLFIIHVSGFPPQRAICQQGSSFTKSNIASSLVMQTFTSGALNLARWAQLTQASTDILDSR